MENPNKEHSVINKYNSKQEELKSNQNKISIKKSTKNIIYKAESLNFSSNKTNIKAAISNSLTLFDSSALNSCAEKGLVLSPKAENELTDSSDKPILEKANKITNNDNNPIYNNSHCEETLSIEQICKNKIEQAKNISKQANNDLNEKQKLELDFEFEELTKKENINNYYHNDKNTKNIISISNKPIEKTKRKYTKSKDIEDSEQKYCCTVCGRKYLSYPAFYTHKRNRHHIISITDRHNLFQKKGSDLKYNYNSIGYGKIISLTFSDSLIKTMNKTLVNIYQNEKSLFY